MPSKPHPVHHFECPQCGLFFTTLDAGLTHLRRATEHIAESHDLMEAHGSKYRSVAARKLTVSTVLTTDEANALITDLELRRAIREAPSTLKRKTNRQRNRILDSDSSSSPEDTPVRKRASKPTHVGPAPALPLPTTLTPGQSTKQSQAVAHVNTIVLAPITVRVTVYDRPRTEQYCNFSFDRAKHRTIRKLLDAAAAAYREETGAEVDFAALSRIRMMMKLVDHTGEAVGGKVCQNRDLDGVVKVKGDGWFGQLEVG